MTQPLALVTGASRNIRSATDLQHAADHFSIPVNCHTLEEVVNPVCTQIRNLQQTCIRRQFDIGPPVALDNAAHLITEALDTISVFVNYPETGTYTLPSSVKPDNWKRITDSNQGVLHYWTAEIIRIFVRQLCRARIVNVTTIWAYCGPRNYAPARSEGLHKRASEVACN